MKKSKNFSKRLIAMLLSTAMIFAPILESMPVYAAEPGAETEEINTGALFAASASDFSNVGGWNESIYAEIAGVKDADVTEVSWSGAITGNLTGDDLTYLVRDNGNGGVRIDIPGLKAGTYTLTVKAGGSTLTKSDIEVYAYDRSGYAHFNYTEGVGAYNDDGTLKKNAIVLYVTDENKNTVSLSDGKTTVKGIGNILNNSSIFKNLAQAGKPLVVRFIGCVSETGLYKRGSYDAKDAGKIDGLTNYVFGSDNGHMARIQSGKDITLEGIGYDAVIDGWGFHYVAKSDSPEYGKSFEVRNLTFINTPEDAVGMEGAQKTSDVSSDLLASVERCWIHNNEFYCPEITNPAEDDKAEGDGSVDFKRGQYFTCSYNYFDGCHKTNLVGADKNSLQYNLTYHHNYWYMCKARGPLARNANIHMYNNIVEKQRDYFQNARATSYIFSEYNLFYACSNPQDPTNAKDGNGAIKSYRDSIASVIKMDNPAEVVQNKTDYVANNCQFSARKIQYDKFDTDPGLSYIPGNNYRLDTDFTDLRKVVASQTGVQKQNPKRPEEITAGDYSVVKGTTANKVDALPKNLTPGKVKTYAFTVNEAFDLTVAYKSADTAPGVLVNEAGENLLTGDGSLTNLPAGTYMIQAKNFQPWAPASGGKAETAFSFNEITINTLNITKTTAHVHKWVLDVSKSVAATCTAAGKNFYTCEADKDGQKCDETKEEPVKALGHSWSEWTVDKPATETETGQKSRSCTRCDAKETETIPIIIQNISWDFAELNKTTDIETINGDQYYAGLKLTGNIKKNKDYLLANGDATITIPNLKKGDKVIVKYCYEASFTLGETTVDEKSGSTDQIDKVEHIVTADGSLVIKNSSKGTVGKQTFFCGIEIVKAENLTPYTPVLSVGQDKDYKTIGDALAVVKKMTRTADQKVTIMIDPGNYEEMLVIDIPNVTLQNASATPSIDLKNKGVDIDDNAVRVTWYYGHGYTYYSMDSNCKYDAGVLAANKSKGSASFTNPGAGTTNGSYWNATVIISANNFTAKDIIFENSFNQYVSAKSLEDVIEAQTGKEGAKEGTVKRAAMKTLGDTKVQEKDYVERAAALAITNNTKAVYFNNCKFVGRQDTLYGGTDVTAGFEYCSIYGGTDYIFGGMTAVFKQCDLVFNTNDQTDQGLKNDVGYITAPQQAAGRGYLMYKCTVTSTVPGVDTASAHTSKPGYLGRPWQANTGEAVFYKTTIEKADSFWNKGSYSYGESLIRGAGWGDGLGGQSALCGEYGTIEESGVDNSSKRASWSKVFTEEKLADGTPISIKSFLKDWEVPFDSDDPNVPVPKQYTITIDRQNGTDLVVKTVAEGTALTETDLPTPTREGYNFIGWVDSSNKSVTLPYTPTANITIKALWEKIIEIDPNVRYNMKLISLDIPTGTYTSDFQKNGFTITAGEGTDQSVSVDVGSEKTIGGTKYTGRLKTGGIGTKDYRSIKVTTEDAATLTMACVVATTGDECELGVATLNENGEFVEITTGITVDGKAANKITLSGSKGNLVTVALPAADTYYIYSKGSTLGGNNSGGVNFYAINVTYANGVDPVFYTVTFDSKGGLSEESQKVQAGDACVEPAEILKSGYTFDGWYADSECTQKYDFSAPVMSNLTLYAKWLAGEPDGEYLVLDMKDLPARDYKEIFKRNGFTFKATSDKNLSVDTSAVTVDGVDYTRRLKLNGTGDKDNRNISFTIEANATLTLVAASGKSGTGRALTVTNGTTTYNISNIDAAAKYTQELTAGTWQIYAAGEGVNIYYISVKGESVKAQYVIAIDRQDGTEAVVKKVEEGTELTEADLPSTLTREGYTFQGWVDEDGNAITVPYTPTKSMTIKAKWQQEVAKNQYVITIDKQDGTEAVVKTVDEGTELTETDLPATLTKEGYTFQGWVDEKGNAITVPYTPTKSMTIKAKWQQNVVKNQYVITIDKQDGTEAVVKTIVEGTELTETDLPATLTREGYTFQGWVDEDGNAITVPYTPTKSMTIKAKWQQEVAKNQYVITIDKQDGTTATVKTVVEGTELTETDLPSTLTREGYTFQGWVDEDGNAITVPYTPTKSMTIKAKWQQNVVKNQYVITIDKQDGTEAVVKTVVEGTELTETDLPSTLTREGYTFQGWVDEDGNAITVPYTPTKSMTIKAKWQQNVVKNQYVITIDKQDGTEAVVKTIVEGTELTETDLPATLTREGYTFQGWIDEDGNAITVPYTPAKSMTIKAKWQSSTAEPKIGLHVELAVPDKTYVYTGSAIKPAIIVTNNGELLTEGVDYTVKYSNNIKACEWGKNEAAPKKAPKITVTGKGNLTGSAFTNFRIEKKDIGETDITGGTASVKAGSVTVTKGSKAVPVLVYNGVKLGTKDYTYNNPAQKNQKFGSAATEEEEVFEIELKGTGNYKGSRKVTVKAVKKDVLKTFTVTVGKVDLTYTGQSQLLPADAITVQDKTTKQTLKNDSEHTYYEIVYGSDTTSAGTVKFSVVGVGEYTGTVTKTYKIKPLKDNSKFYVDQNSIKKSYDYNSAGVTLGEDLQVYYGKDANGTKLQEGADYKVTYSSNKKVGKGKYTITFLGNFKGSKKTGEFNIGAASLKESGAKVEAADKVFKKAGIYKSAPYVTIDGVALKASDYKAEYYIVNADGSKTLMGGGNKVTTAGTVIEVKVTGKGSYKTGDEDSVTGYYTVCDKGSRTDLSGAKVTFYEKNADGRKGRKVTKLEYTGNAVEPAIVEVTVKGQTEPLKEGEDYTLCYVNNRNKGKATVIITAAENSDKYAGSKTATFSIVARNLKYQTDLLNNLFKIFGQ